MATTFVANTDSSVRNVEYPPSGLRKMITGLLTTDGTDGAANGDIPASVFGLTKLERAAPLVKSDNSLLVAVAPSYDGSSLLGKAAATAAVADIPSGTYRAEVSGY